MSMHTIRGLVGFALALQVAVALLGCSGGKKSEELAPAELTEFKAALNASIVWQVSVGSARGAFLRPAVLDQAIYAASAGGNLVRIAPETGQVVWQVDTKENLGAGVGSDGLTVAVATKRGEVVAYDAEGTLRWRARVPSDVTTPPLVGRGLVIVRSTDRQVTAFGADNGARRWTYQRSNPPLTLHAPTELSFVGDNVMIGFPAGRLVAVASANGAVRWEVVVGEPKGATEVERLTDVMGPIAATTAGGRDACAAAFQGRIACVDAGSGTLRWNRDWSAGAGVAIDERNVYSVDASSHVGAFARSNGASVWRNDQLANRKLTTPLALRSAIVVGDYKGYVHFLAPTDGALIARVRPDSSAIVTAPQAWSGSAIVQTQDGTVARITADR